MTTNAGLITFLLAEIAVCGINGATVSQVTEFVKTYFQINHSAVNEDGEDIGLPVATRTVDQAYLEQVWIWLIQNPHIRVGRQGQTRKSILSEIETYNNEVSRHSNSGVNGNAVLPRELPQSTIKAYASEEQIWYALAGHPQDFKRITQFEFACLSAIASTREQGIFQPELVRLTGQDKRSVPPRTERLSKAGYIVKTRVTAGGSNTSKLILKRFAHDQGPRKASHAPQLNEDAASAIVPVVSDETQTKHFIVQDFLENLGRTGFLVWEDLQLVLEIPQSPAISRFLSAVIEQLESLGCVQRYKTEILIKGHPPIAKRCIKLLRDPSPIEVQSSIAKTKTYSVPHTSEKPLNSNQSASEHKTPGIRTGPFSSHEQDLNNPEERRLISRKDGVNVRTVMQWDPDRSVFHTVRDVVQKNDKNDGVSNGEIVLEIATKMYRRPLEQVLGRIGNSWQLQQPPHLQHLGLVKDTRQINRQSVYIHYTPKQFQNLVNLNKATWDSVKFGQKQQVPAKVDGYGFPALPDSIFAGSGNNKRLFQCIAANSEAAGRHGNKSVRKGAIHSSTGRPKGRPRKYPKEGVPENFNSLSESQLAALRTSQSRARYYEQKKNRHGAQLPTSSLVTEDLTVAPGHDDSATEELPTIAAQDSLEIHSILRKDTGPPKIKGRPRKVLPYFPSVAAHSLISHATADRVKPKMVSSLSEIYVLSSTGYFPSILAHFTTAYSSRKRKSSVFVNTLPKSFRLKRMLGLEGPASYSQVSHEGSDHQRQITEYNNVATYSPVFRKSKLHLLRKNSPEIASIISIPVEKKIEKAIDSLTSPQGVRAILPSIAAHTNLYFLPKLEPHTLAPSTGRTRKLTSKAISNGLGVSTKPSLRGSSIVDPLEELPVARRLPDECLSYEQQEKRIERPNSGVFIGEFCILKKTPSRGRPPKSRLAIFKSSRLREANLQHTRKVTRQTDATQSGKTTTIQEARTQSLEAPQTPIRDGYTDHKRRLPAAESTDEPNPKRRHLTSNDGNAQELTSQVAASHSQHLQRSYDDPKQQGKKLFAQKHADVTPVLKNSLEQDQNNSSSHENHFPVSSAQPDTTETVEPFPPADFPYTPLSKKAERAPKPERPRGSVVNRRQEIILSILRDANGVFPGDKEIWYPFTTIWMRESNGIQPDRRTVTTVTNYLLSQRKLHKYTFSFQNRHGIATTKSIFMLPDITYDDPRVTTMKENIIAYEPKYYIPDGIEIAKELIPAGPNCIIGSGPYTSTYAASMAKKRKAKEDGENVGNKSEPKRKRKKETKEKEKKIDAKKKGKKQNVKSKRVALTDDERDGSDIFEVSEEQDVQEHPAVSDSYLSPKPVVTPTQNITSQILKPQESAVWDPYSKERTLLASGSRSLAPLGTISHSTSPTDTASLQIQHSGPYFPSPHFPTPQPPSPHQLGSPMQTEPHIHTFNGFYPMMPNTFGHLSFASSSHGVQSQSFPIPFTPYQRETEGTPEPTSVTQRQERKQGQKRVPKRGREQVQEPHQEPAQAPEDTPTKKPRKKSNFVARVMKTRRLDSIVGKLNERPEPVEERTKKIRARGPQQGKLSGDKGRRFFIAVLIVRTLLGGVEKTIDWDMVTHILAPEYTLDYVRKSWNGVRETHKPISDKMQEEFQEMFIQAYEAKQIPAINYDDLESYDWKWLHKWTMNRFSTASQSLVDFPATRAELDQSYELHELSTQDTIDYYELGNKATAQRRHFALHRYPCFEPLVEKRRIPEEYNPVSVAANWIRANVVTPDSTYKPEDAREKIKQLGEDVINEAMKQLLSAKVIMTENKGRLMPGRSYDISESYINKIKGPIEVPMFREAATFKESLDEKFLSGEAVYIQEAVGQGEIMAITNMMSTHRITLVQHDVPMKKWGLVPDGGYRTRDIDKSNYFFPIELRPSESYEYGNPVLHDLDGPRCQCEVSESGMDITKFPVWYDIHGDLVPVMWDLARAAVLSMLAIRPGLTVQALEESFKSSLERFEIALLLSWIVSAGAGSWIGSKEGSINLGEWWWLSLGLDKGKGKA